jgi:hypothetical protein
MGQYLDVPGRHVGVDHTLGPFANLALHGQDELSADAFGLGENLGPVRVEYDLQQALAITEVYEDHATVVTAPVHPAADRHFFADQRLFNLSAIMAAHGDTGH